MKPRHPGEPGQGLVEYTLVLVLITVIVVIALVLLGPSLGDIFNYLTNILVPS